MSVYVLGVATHPPSDREVGLRLEEMAYYTTRTALADAGVTRRQLDSITLASSDELDGRPISSMLMSAPAGGYETDEIKVADSGATALCLAYARFVSGESQLGVVASWCKSSKADIEAVMRLRADPFYSRPLGIDGSIADALFAQAVTARFGLQPEEINNRVVAAYVRGARNPRGLRHTVPSTTEIATSSIDAVPLRAGQRAPLTDGAAALVVASERYVRSHPGCRPLARIAGVGWATDSYRLDASRLREMRSAREAWHRALQQARVGAADLDVVELDAQTGYHEAAYVRAFDLPDPGRLTPSGGPFAQNPVFCSGLVHAVEAVLQVSGRAGEVQRPRARWAAAHGCYGYAQQGNVVIVFEGDGGIP